MITTKINIPLQGKNHLPRLESFKKLEEGISKKLTLVTAPGGYGKTTLICDWIFTNNITVAWLSIDYSENDIVFFTTYLIHSLQKISERFGSAILEYIRTISPLQPEILAEMLINEIARQSLDFILVLDDYHYIDNPNIHKLMSIFLNNQPENIHTIILSRSEPSLPIAKLRSKCQLTEIGLADLSFSSNEVHALFNKKMGIKISIDEACQLTLKTEGWVTGLYLTALSMQTDFDIPVVLSRLQGTNRNISDYLLEEVFNFQPENVKQFLILSSALEQISVSLCNAALCINNCEEMIAHLDKNNLFIVRLDSERKWYRYHHLFKDFLQQKLLNINLQDKNDIWLRSSIWFEKNGVADLSIEYALKAENYERAAELLNGSAEEMWENGLHSVILKFGDSIPEKLIKTMPCICLFYSWVLIFSGQVQKAKSYLQEAETLLLKRVSDNQMQNTDYQDNDMFTKISVALSYLHIQLNNPELSLRYVSKAMQHMEDESPFWHGWTWFSKGMAYYILGDFSESLIAFQNAVNYGKKSQNLHLISTIVMRMADIEQQLGLYRSVYAKCDDFFTFMKNIGFSDIIAVDWSYAGLYAIKGSTEYMWGNIDDAYENAKIASKLCKKGKDIMLETSVLLLYSMVLHEKKMYKDAELKIFEAEKFCKKDHLPLFLFNALMAWKLFHYIDMNEDEKASILVKELNLSSNDEINHINESVYMVFAKFLLLHGNIPEAEKVLSCLNVLIIAGKRVERLIDIKVTYSVYYKLTGELDKAYKYLLEALALASAENLIMFFINSMGQIDDLLIEICEKPSLYKGKIPSEFMDNLKNIVERKHKYHKNINPKGLSIRELETLRLLAENLSNQEISAKLFVSLPTTKTHVRNILQKLEAKNRQQAVQISKSAGWI